LRRAEPVVDVIPVRDVFGARGFAPLNQGTPSDIGLWDRGPEIRSTPPIDARQPNDVLFGPGRMKPRR